MKTRVGHLLKKVNLMSKSSSIDLDEVENIKNGKIHISKKDYAKKPKEYKGNRNGKPTLMALDPKTGSTTSFEVVFEEVELDENKLPDMREALRQVRTEKPVQLDEGNGYNEAYELGTDEYREYIEKLTPGESKELDEVLPAIAGLAVRAVAKKGVKKAIGDGEEEVDEASARADAMGQCVRVRK